MTKEKENKTLSDEEKKIERIKRKIDNDPNWSEEDREFINKKLFGI